MADPFISEIKIMGFAYAPRGWAHCNGQLLPINQNQALFSLLGTTYGGNGVTTFALPDLRGRTPVHFTFPGHPLGERAGEQAHTLSIAELPTHTHVLSGSGANADANEITGRSLGTSNNAYRAPTNLTALNSGSITNAGGSQAHQNMQPFLTLSFCIALQGIFPSQN